MSNLDRMKQLMGVKPDTTSKSTGSALKIMEGADGKKYGIFKEGKEYFLKSTEKGSDNFDYVDGLRHKRNYVYESFAKANKQLVSKMHALTESLGKKDDVITESKLKLDMVKPLMTESAELCQCGGNCQCGKDKKDETIFESTEIVEEMMYEALDSATSKDVLKMVQEVSEEWGTDCVEFKTLKEFALANCNLKNLDETLTESTLHQLNKTLSELKMAEYKSEGIFEMAEKLAEEKYKLKVDVPEDEKEVDFSMDSEEGDVSGEEEFDFSDEGDAEVSDDKPFDDEPFDAGVEASEEEDPKKFIQQLAGKLGQSLRDYTKGLDEPDFDLEKFAINSVISATNTADMSEEDQEDIIAKIKEAGEGEVNGEMDSEEGEESGAEFGDETIDSEEEVSDIKDEETEEEGSEDLGEGLEIDESMIEAIAMEALKEMDEVYEEETEESLLDEDDHPMKKAFKIEK